MDKFVYDSLHRKFFRLVSTVPLKVVKDDKLSKNIRIQGEITTVFYEEYLFFIEIKKGGIKGYCLNIHLK